MSYNIKGITVKINGDASNLQREINKIKAETSGLDKQMSTLKKSMKGLDGKDFQSMAQYQQLVSTKMQSLTKQANQYQKTLDAMPKSYEAWNKQISTLTSRNKELEANIKNGTGSIIGQTQELTKNKEVLKSLGNDWDAYDQKLQSTKTNLLSTQNNLKALSKEFITTNSSILKLYTGLDNAALALDNFSNKTKYISMGSAAAIAGATMAAISFEDAWTGVLKTTEGTPAQLEKINNGIKELATSTSSSYESIAHYAELAGQLGVATDSIVGFTETVTMLGDTTNLIGDEAAQQIAKFANIMVSTEGQTNEYFSRLGSSIVDLGNNFATTEADIMNMSMRLATAGRQVGFTSQDVLGLAAALSSVGIEAAAGGGSMSKMLKNVEYAVATNSEALQAFAEVSGMTGEQFVQLWGEDAPTAFGKLLEGIGKSENITKTLDDLGITEVRMSNAMGALAQNTDLYWNAINRANSAFEQNHAMTAEAEKRYATLKSTLIQTWEAIKQAADELGQSFAPKLESIAGLVKDAADWFTNLDDSTKDTIADLLLFGASLSPVSKGLSKVASVSAGAVKGIAKIASGVASLPTPFSIAAGGAIAVAGGLSLMAQRAEESKDAFNEQLASQDAMYASTMKLIDGIDEYNQSIQEHKDASEEYIASYQTQAKETGILLNRIEQLTEQENLSNTQKELLLSSIDELNQIYPELGLYYDENTGKLADNTGAVYDNVDALRQRVDALKEEAKAEAYANAIKETTQALIEQEMQYQQLSASIKDTKDKMNQLAEGGFTEEEVGQFSALQDTLTELMGEYDGLQSKIIETNQTLLDQANIAETGGLTLIGDSLKTSLQGAIDTATRAGIEIPQNLTQGIMNGTESYNAASAYVASLLTFQGAVQNGTWAGNAISQNVAYGVINGAPNVLTASMYLENLLKFSSAIQEAGYTGAEIPKSLATEIANGTIPVETAVSALMNGGVSELQKQVDKMKQDAQTGTDGVVSALESGSSGAGQAGKSTGSSYRKELSSQLSAAESDARRYASNIQSIIDSAIDYANSHPVVITQKTVKTTEEKKPKAAPAMARLFSLPNNTVNNIRTMASDYVTPYAESPEVYQTLLSSSISRSRSVEQPSSKVISNLSNKIDKLIESFTNAKLFVRLQPQELNGEVITDTVDEIHTIRELLYNTGNGGR